MKFRFDPRQLAGCAVSGFLFCAASSAQAGLCGAQISTDWTEIPRENQSIMSTFESPDFNACETASVFTGVVKTEYNSGDIDEDAFSFSVEALDGDSLRLTAQSINLNLEDTHNFPTVTLTLTDIGWPGGSGAIEDVLNAGGSTNWFEVVAFTADSISFEWSLFSVGGTILHPVEVTFFQDFDIVPAHASVPEPGTLAIFAAGVASLGVACRRRRQVTDVRGSSKKVRLCGSTSLSPV